MNWKTMEEVDNFEGSPQTKGGASINEAKIRLSDDNACNTMEKQRHQFSYNG